MAAPVVVTDNAKNVARYSATLVGHCTWVDPAAAVSYIIFEWGKTTAYGDSTYWEVTSPGEVHEHDISDLEENTLYHFRIVGWVGGVFSYGADKSFTTTTVGPPPAPTPFMGWIIEKLNSVSGWFYGVYLIVIDWPWPFWYAAEAFYWLSTYFNGLAWNFYDFSIWVDDIANKIVTILSFANIYDYFKDFFDAAINAWAWVVDSFWNVWDVVDIWWTSTSTTVLDWIDATKDWARLWIDYLQDQIVALTAQINDLVSLIPDMTEILAWFSNWTGNVVSAIDSWWTGALSQVQSLINSAFIEREPFWAGWQDWRDKVTEFFTDPEDWLYKAADRIIDRFW